MSPRTHSVLFLCALLPEVDDPSATALADFFFCCERLSASMARSLHLSFICIPQSTRALDQGGVESRQAVSPKALRPWTIPLRYSVGSATALAEVLASANSNLGPLWVENPDQDQSATLDILDAFCSGGIF